MIIRAARPDRHFTQLRNDVLRDNRLSFRARGVLAAILSRPDDWRTTSEALAAESPSDGRDAIRSSLKELEVLGYLRYAKLRGADGRLATVVYVYDEPPVAASPGPENPSPVPPAQTQETAGRTGDGSTGAGEPGPFRTLEPTNTLNTKTSPPASRPEAPDPDVAVLVGVLRSEVETHQGRAPKTTGWEKPMGLLLRRGPTDWADPGPIAAEEVAAVIRWVFHEEPEGFWANQVRSPEALRRHWTKIDVKRRRGGRRSPGGDVVAQAQARIAGTGRVPGQTFGPSARCEPPQVPRQLTMGEPS